MSTTFRWLIPILVMMIFVFFVSYRGLVQNTATTATATVEGINEIVSTGIARGEFDARKTTAHFVQEELAANILADVASAQKAHGFDVEIDYVFLDEAGRITTNTAAIRSIQLRAAYWKDGERKATSEKRLALNMLATD